MPPSQTDVAGQRPRQRSVTAPSDHSTPSASVPVPRTPDTSVCRTSWKSRGFCCVVFCRFTLEESPTRAAPTRCDLWAVQAAHSPLEPL